MSTWSGFIQYMTYDSHLAQLTLNTLSMTSAPVEITGRSSMRYTVSVVEVLLCPTKCEISSTRTPCSQLVESSVPTLRMGRGFGGRRVVLVRVGDCWIGRCRRRSGSSRLL